MESGDDESGGQALFRTVRTIGAEERSPADPAGEAGHRYLLECGDPILASLVRHIGPLGPVARRRGRPGGAYGSLVRTIVGQQLSTKAAEKIYARLVELLGDGPPTPEELLAADENALRAAGLSRPKIGYLRHLARHVLAGDLELYRLEDLTDDEVRERITAVKGLGRWSADMFLMFYLGRPDVLPIGDLGVRRAVERAYGLPGLPDEDELRALAEPWRPRRTLACLYLWESLDKEASRPQ